MDHGESGQTSCCVGTAAGDVDVRVSHSADRDMGVPKSDVSGSGACHVDLEDDGTGSNIRDGETHVLDLCNAGLSWLAYHDDRSRFVLVPKGAPNAYIQLSSKHNLLDVGSYLK